MIDSTCLTASQGLRRVTKMIIYTCIIIHTQCASGATVNHFMPEKFENAGFTLRTHQLFSVIPRRRNFKTQKITATLDLYLRKASMEIMWLSWLYRFRKAPFSGQMVSIRTEAQSRKAPFSWRINESHRPNRRHKAAFSNFSHVELTGPFLGTTYKGEKDQTKNVSLRNSFKIKLLVLKI